MARVVPPNLPEDFQRGVKLLDDFNANDMNIFANLVATAINLSDDEIQENLENITKLLNRGSIVSVTGTRNLAVTDAYNYLRVTTSSNVTLTVLPQTSVSWEDGTEISVIDTTSSGNVTFAAGVGVTINSKDNALQIDGQWSAVALKRISEDVWDLVGALA